MRDFDDFIKKLKRKDLKALDYLVLNYSNIIFKYCNGVLNNRELSRECVNDVIFKIWNNIDSFDRKEEKFIVWVLAISKYTAIDILRKESKYYNASDISEIAIASKDSIEKEFICTEDIQEIKEEINNMNEVDREIFLRKFFDDESSIEIGKSLGLTEKFINLRIFRGRKKLREKFGVRGV
ncbi:sigma-70 family RNA polymerase sigma factor [uncultured Clostridium sp.]|uniref:sigma-70 family RNA polymerase sigma factor n=1 Tax=uncultured Clostridium sp. TaxID=59620 RepID=UPI0026172E37|nr:sigma-70 family RNA polymerase sigma factor [uncultured Clostridium sp.]